MTDLNDLNEFAGRYIALWNEPDADLRRKAVTDLFAPDAAHYTPSREVHGHDQFQERVTTAYQQWVEPGVFAFRAVPDADGHHDAVRFNWEMYRLDDGSTQSRGFDFITLNEQGLIVTDHQFVD
jgi:hypothetical protein